MSQQNSKMIKQTVADFHFMIGFLSIDDMKIGVKKCHKMFTVS